MLEDIAEGEAELAVGVERGEGVLTEVGGGAVYDLAHRAQALATLAKNTLQFIDLVEEFPEDPSASLRSLTADDPGQGDKGQQGETQDQAK